MRGIFHTPQRFSARAFLAGAALLAGASTTQVRAQTLQGHTSFEPDRNEETAFAMPRLAPRDGGSVALPRPLSVEDAATVRRIFNLQRAGNFDTAIAETARLNDDTLLPDILADRFLNPSYHPSQAQLRLWLRTYAAMPDAVAIHEIALSGLPKGTVLPPLPTRRAPLAPDSDTLRAASLHDDESAAGLGIVRNAMLDRTVRERAGTGRKGARSALRLIAATPGMTDLYAAQLQAEVALTLLGTGETTLALQTAEAATRRSGGRLGLGSYVAGLAAWQDGRADIALPLFEAASRAPLTTPAILSASAFWAARSHERMGDMAAYEPWLYRAAAAPRSFYGMLATEILDRSHASAHPANAAAEVRNGIQPLGDRHMLRPSVPVLGEIDVEAVQATPQGRHLFALLQVGETARAETLIRATWPEIEANGALGRSMQLVSAAAGLDALAHQIDAILVVREGRPVDAADAPMPHLTPHHGFRMDPALVYALTRIESNFDPHAASGPGARGLMQLMPTTAAFVTRDGNGPVNAAGNLQNPSLNLEVGQLYVLYLAQLSRSTSATGLTPDGGDLIRVLASYNAGPGMLTHDNPMTTADPLLFIETLPGTETRDYVHHALTYLWIYARKMDLPTPSLAALGRGEWPGFAAEQQMAPHSVTFH